MIERQMFTVTVKVTGTYADCVEAESEDAARKVVEGRIAVGGFIAELDEVEKATVEFVYKHQNEAAA